MLLILNNKLRSYRFKDYVFLPDKPVEVTDENDIYDLLGSNKVAEIPALDGIRGRFKGLFGPEEGRLSIGIIRIGGIGDTLQLGAHAKAVKRKYPGCFITAFVRDRSDQEILESNPNVDRIIQTGLSSWDRIVERYNREYDIFYDFRYVTKVIYNREGFQKDKKITDKKFYACARYYHEFTKSNYELCQKIKKNVIDISNDTAGLTGSPDDMEFILQFHDTGYSRILENEKYVTLHTSAGNYRVTKLWHVSRWTKVIKYLKQKGFKTVQVGNSFEPAVPGTINLLGLTSIGQTASLIANAKFHLGTESGITHLAKSVKTPGIILFGSSPTRAFGYDSNLNIRKCDHPACWYSWDEWYMKCRKTGNNESACMNNIEVSDVTEAIDEMLKRTKNRVNMKISEVDTADISVITPVLNALEWFKQETESLFIHSKGIKFEFIVIDNGSDNNTKKYLKSLKELPNIRILTNDKNLGYAKANNQGAKIAKGNILLFLNSDVRVGHNFLQDILSAFTADKKLDATGACGGILDSNLNCLGETRNNGDRWDYLVGWCLAVRKDVFEEIGGFDERYGYGYCEDTDLSYRLKHDGYKINILEVLKIHHFSNKTVFRQKDFDPYVLTMQNHEKFRQKWLVKKPAGKINKICVIRSGGLGDVLLTFPIVKELKRKHPGSELTYVTTETCKDLLNGCPYIDRISTDTIYAKEKFDMVLEPKYEHSPKRYMHTMADSIGIKIKDKRLFYNLTDESKKFARNILKDNPAVCFHTGRTWRTREWDILRFKEVAQYIADNYGFQIIELGRYDTQVLGIPGNVDLRGKLNFDQLAAVINECELFVGIDSFCLHLATSVGTPVVGIYGSTQPELVEVNGSKSYPVRIELSCSGCRHRTPGIFVNCNNVYCMQGITADMVTGRVKESLESA